MRITNTSIVNNMMKHLQKNMNNLDQLSQKLSSGKEFQLPSENPIGAAHSMQFKTLISINEQYQKNLNQARNWMETSEMALNDAGEILQRGRELAVYGATDSLNHEDRITMAEEVKELKEEFISIANSTLGDRYLFSGQSTDLEPFTFDNEQEEYVFQGDYNQIKREINSNVEIAININGDQAFTDGINAIENLYQGLMDNDKDLIDSSIGELDTVINRNTNYRAEIGAKINRMDLIESRLEDELINLRRLQSENEDTDIAKTITDLKMQESVYRASLATGARIIQPTLIDFLN